MKGLTGKQQNILDFVEKFSQEENMAPTVYEIADYFNITPPTAFAHIRSLKEKKYLSRSSRARSIKLLNTEAQQQKAALTVTVPVLGRYTPGTPLLAEENREGNIQFIPSLLPRGTGGHRLYCLKMDDDGMREAGILAGDMLIAKHVENAELGALVVALVGGKELVVRYFYLQDEMVELRPANERFESQLYSQDQVGIAGVVVLLHRSY